MDSDTYNMGSCIKIKLWTTVESATKYRNNIPGEANLVAMITQASPTMQNERPGLGSLYVEVEQFIFDKECGCSRNISPVTWAIKNVLWHSSDKD